MKKTFPLIISVALVFFALNIHAQEKPTVLSTRTKKQIVDTIAKKLNDNYVFADTALRMGRYIQTRLKNGSYDTIKNPKVFADKLNEDIWSIYHDGHFGIRYSTPIADSIPKKYADTETLKRRQAFARRVNYGVSKVEILDGNIGYIKIDGFWGVIKQSKSVVNAAFRFVANSNALLIDLRENHGGDPEMVTYMAGFLFKNKTHLNDLYERRSKHLDQFWTVPDTSFSIADIPLYILTDKTTFSAGEEFTYDLQAQKRAIVIGESTGGGAHPVEPQNVGYGFVADIPFARAINPITKTNWEKTGVKPDVEVAAHNALDIALEKIKTTAAPTVNNH